VPLMLVLVPEYGAAGAAAASLAAAALTAPFELFLLTKTIDLGPRDFLAPLWRPALGTLAMTLAVILIRTQLPIPVSLVERIGFLAGLAAAGALAYAATVFLLWRSVRESNSAEAWLIERAQASIASLGQRLLRSRPI